MSFVRRLERLDLVVTPDTWAFARERRAEIDAHFEMLRQSKPALWNGRVLLMHEHRFDGDCLSGAYLETDFAAFCAWRDWGRPETGAGDVYSAAAVLSADGAFLLGRMAAHTYNAGQSYFPCGTPDSNDVKDGRVDLEFSVRRELNEETGLVADELSVEKGWTAVMTQQAIALIKIMRSDQGADALHNRVLSHIARDKNAELSGVEMIRWPDDIGEGVSESSAMFLRDYWKDKL